MLYEKLPFKDLLAVSGQHIQEQHTEDPAGNDLPGADGEGIIAIAAKDGHSIDQQPVSVDQNQRNDECVCHDGTDRRTPLFLPQQIRAERAKERCETSKDNVRQGTASQDIAEQAADKESWDCGGGKKWKNGKRLRKPDLDGVVGEAEGVGNISEHNVEGSDQRCLCQIGNFLVSHIYFSPLVLFYEWKVSNTRFI